MPAVAPLHRRRRRRPPEYGRSELRREGGGLQRDGGRRTIHAFGGRGADDGVELTYADLVRRAVRLAAALREHRLARGSRVGVVGSRSLIAIEAVLAVAWAGATYVPLGVRWPGERPDAVLLALGRLDAVIVDGNGLNLLTPALLAATKVLGA